MIACGLALAEPSGERRVLAQSDLDALMREVVEKRDDNWTKLPQYVLDEHEQVTVRGPNGVTVWGEQRDYGWYIRDGFFVRSPLKVNGAIVGDRDRRRYEATFIEEESRRERRQRERGRASSDLAPADPASSDAVNGNDVVALMSQGRRPQFISLAYFLRFSFETGRYALVGREMVEGLETLKVEYYPTALFRERPFPDANRRDDPVSAETRRLVNKVSLVTLWIDPKAKQIVRYTFDNVSLDFLPTQWFSRITDIKASMTMGQAFPDVWLPKRIEVNVAGMLAIGQVDVEYATQYQDYRRADVGSKVVVPGGR